MPEPDAPDPIAALDQALRGMADVGRIFHSYYSGLIAAGFEMGQAFALTLNYQTLMFHASQTSDDA